MGTQAAGECFHSFFECCKTSQVLMVTVTSFKCYCLHVIEIKLNSPKKKVSVHGENFFKLIATHCTIKIHCSFRK